MMDELRYRAGPDSFAVGKGVDVDFILLKIFGCDPDFVDLPDSVLGKTIFTADGDVDIQISKLLVEKSETSDVSRRRLRTTIGHEIGHASCHRELFMRDTSTLSLFDNADKEQERPNSILCRESSVFHNRYNGEWWEYQANRCMAALMLPRDLLREQINELLALLGCSLFEEAIQANLARNVVHKLTHQFDVSREAILYRLKDLGYVSEKAQTRMELST
jgi:Zn-dependent peptidase ImmA (M78 family)